MCITPLELYSSTKTINQLALFNVFVIRRIVLILYVFEYIKKIITFLLDNERRSDSLAKLCGLCSQDLTILPENFLI